MEPATLPLRSSRARLAAASRKRPPPPILRKFKARRVSLAAAWAGANGGEGDMMTKRVLLTRMGFDHPRLTRNAPPIVLGKLLKGIISLQKQGRWVTLNDALQIVDDLEKRGVGKKGGLLRKELDPDVDGLSLDERRLRFENLYGIEPPTPFQFIQRNIYLQGTTRCRQRCMNRQTQVECVVGRCRLGKECTNNEMQTTRGQEHRKVVLVARGIKGWGVAATRFIRDGELIVQYCGEVCNEDETMRRCDEYRRHGIRHHYFLRLSNTEIIDATKKSSLGRFINHSCDSNCVVEKWQIRDHLAVGVFADRDIREGEEISIDYDFVRGYIGPKVKPVKEISEHEMRRKANSMSDEWRNQLLKRCLNERISSPRTTDLPAAENPVLQRVLAKCIARGQDRHARFTWTLEESARTEATTTTTLASENDPDALDPELGIPMIEVERCRMRERNMRLFQPSSFSTGALSAECGEEYEGGSADEHARSTVEAPFGVATAGSLLGKGTGDIRGTDGVDTLMEPKKEEDQASGNRTEESCAPGSEAEEEEQGQAEDEEEDRDETESMVEPGREC